MIQRLAQASISFMAEAAPRDVYENMMSRNSQTVQKQNNAVANTTSNQVKNQIPMQGAGQKLDIIA